MNKSDKFAKFNFLNHACPNLRIFIKVEHCQNIFNCQEVTDTKVLDIDFVRQFG